MNRPLVCGLDEAGRGPLAGPVCAAAVILSDDFPVELLDDSKRLTAARRETAMAAIYAQAVAWGLGWASAEEIDRINILRASLLAMERAFAELIAVRLRSGRPGLEEVEAIVDGLHRPRLGVPCRAEPKADGRYPPVMAASILAKTARDRMMERYAWLYPEYGFDRHKGYPTAAHRAAIARFGPSPLQRSSFRVGPVQAEFGF